MKLRSIAIGLTGLAAMLASALAAESTPKKTGIRINLDEQPAPAASQAAKSAQPAAPASQATPASEPKRAPAQVAAAGKTPAKSTTAAKSAAPAKKAEAEVKGMEVSRGERGYLGVQIEGGVFKISFYDQKKEPMVADVARIVLRWPVNYQPNDERTMLQPTDDGKAMTSAKIVRPPHAFKLFITLLKDDPATGTTAENHVIDFRG